MKFSNTKVLLIAAAFSLSTKLALALPSTYDRPSSSSLQQSRAINVIFNEMRTENALVLRALGGSTLRPDMIPAIHSAVRHSIEERRAAISNEIIEHFSASIIRGARDAIRQDMQQQMAEHHREEYSAEDYMQNAAWTHLVADAEELNRRSNPVAYHFPISYGWSDLRLYKQVQILKMRIVMYNYYITSLDLRIQDSNLVARSLTATGEAIQNAERILCIDTIESLGFTLGVSPNHHH